ncbi:MAG: hypothetical protein ACXWEY_13940 [Bacteroidia bacterium]
MQVKENFDKVLTVSKMPQGKTYVQGFRIAGKWLKNLGYDYNDNVKISVLPDGSLHISKIGEVQNGIC